jgi:hypothetical protein
MWLINKYGAPCNTDQVFAFALADDPDNEGYYEVAANSNTNTTIAQFTVNAPMSEAAANALLAQIVTLVGGFSFGSP